MSGLMYGLLDELKHHFWFFFAYTTNIAAGETLSHPVGFQITISIYNHHHHHCLTSDNHDKKDENNDDDDEDERTLLFRNRSSVDEHVELLIHVKRITWAHSGKWWSLVVIYWHVWLYVISPAYLFHPRLRDLPCLLCLVIFFFPWLFWLRMWLIKSRDMQHRFSIWSQRYHSDNAKTLQNFHW